MTKSERTKTTISDLRTKKSSGEKITVVTAYDATMSTLIDSAEVDVLMVGDSLGMVVQGGDNTLSVTLDEMAYHCRAVAAARPRAHIVCDLPFLSYQVSPEQALESAGHLLKVGRAESVKLEGGRHVATHVQRVVEAGIPVMGHLGLTPQSVHAMGGFKVQGKSDEAAEALLADARALEQAGVYAIVLEGIPAPVATWITESIHVPTIGIGAGPGTDGQVLVCYDLLGMYRGLAPKFVKNFAKIGDTIEAAVRDYTRAVKDGSFPGEEHTFALGKGQKLYGGGGDQ